MQLNLTIEIRHSHTYIKFKLVMLFWQFLKLTKLKSPKFPITWYITAIAYMYGFGVYIKNFIIHRYHPATLAMTS